MTKEQQLRSEARKAATRRGHQLETRWTLSLAFGRSRQSLRCGACGMHAIIFLDPEPNETGIRGRAVTLNCPGKE
jgi:hypothetical protein